MPDYVFCVAQNTLPGNRTLATFARTLARRQLSGPPAGTFRTFLLGRDATGKGIFLSFVGLDGRTIPYADWPTLDAAEAGHAELLARLQPS
jgi:hypothetical protein